MNFSTEFPDERLRLLFVCAHPAIDPVMHTPLMLQTVLGLGAVAYNFTIGGFPGTEAPGISVFYKQGDEIFHTYSTFARGLETFANTYNYLDLVPKGRDEDSFYFPMAWLRHHDRYEDGRLLDPDRPYWPPEPAVTKEPACCSQKHA